MYCPKKLVNSPNLRKGLIKAHVAFECRVPRKYHGKSTVFFKQRTTTSPLLIPLFFKKFENFEVCFEIFLNVIDVSCFGSTCNIIIYLVQENNFFFKRILKDPLKFLLYYVLVPKNVLLILVDVLS
jgi:hypothetical protein